MSCGRPVLINDVAVFDGRNPPTRSSVLVRGGVIAEIGERPAVGPECERVDGTGATLLPGLIDAHTHTFCRADLQQALMFGVTAELDMFRDPAVAGELKQLIRQELDHHTGLPRSITTTPKGSSATSAQVNTTTSPTKP